MDILSKWEGRRRLIIGGVWVACNYLTVFLQPHMKLDLSLVSSLLEKSTYVAVIGIVGLTGTDAVRTWSTTKACNGGGEKNGGTNVKMATDRPTKET
jgi:hypothetical protein